MLCGIVRSIFNAVFFSKILRHGLCDECDRTFTLLNNLDCDNMKKNPGHILSHQK